MTASVIPEEIEERITWLRLRLAVVEQQARACPPWPWQPGADGYEVLAADGDPVAEGFALSSGQLRCAVEHIAGWDPARAIATVTVDRMVIAAYESTPTPELLALLLATAQKYVSVPDTATVQGPVVEHAVEMSGGSMMVRADAPETEEEYPLASWVDNRQRSGCRVHQRLVLILSPWEPVP